MLVWWLLADAAQGMVAQATGINSGDTAIDISTRMSDMEGRLMEMSLGPLFGLWFRSLFIGLTIWALTICIFIAIYGRMIEIYLVMFIARLAKTVMNVSMGYAVDKKVIAENHWYEESTEHDYINRTLRWRVQLGKKIRSKKEDFEQKIFTKQEVKLKTPSSEWDIPIPDDVLEAILEQRKVYRKNRSRRTSVFDDRGYICCSVTGKPRSFRISDGMRKLPYIMPERNIIV